MSDTSGLSAAIKHLKEFSATFYEGDLIDEESGLTADDLTIIIATIEAFSEDVVAGDPA